MGERKIKKRRTQEKERLIEREGRERVSRKRTRVGSEKERVRKSNVGGAYCQHI